MNKKIDFTAHMFRGYMIPMIFAAAGLAAANIADSVVIGNRVGEAGLSAMSVTAPIYMIYALFYSGLAVGGSLAYSSQMGAGHHEEAIRTFSMLMEASLLIGLIFSALGLLCPGAVVQILGASPDSGETYELSVRYARILLLSAPVFFLNTPLYIFVRNDDDPKLASIGFVTGSVLDVGLNGLFVLVFEMSVEGSALATFTGQTISTLILLFHFTRSKHALRFEPVLPDVKAILGYFVKGAASSTSYVFSVLFIISANRMLESRYTSVGMAILDVILNVGYVVPLFFFAARDSMQPIVSTLHGERNIREEKHAYRLSVKWGMILGCALLAVVFAFPEMVCALFGVTSGTTREVCIPAIRIYLVGWVFGGINLLMAAYYQSVGREKLTYLITSCRGFVMLILYMMIFGWINIFIFWFLFPAAEITTFVLAQVMKGRPSFAGKEKLPDENSFLTLLLHEKQELTGVFEQVEGFCEKFEVPMKQQMYVSNAVEEVCMAILEHAQQEQTPNFCMQVTLCVEPEGGLRLSIRDNAKNFNPFEMKSRKVSSEEEEDDVMAGLGILMVKNKAKKFYYNRYGSFNTMVVLI